MHGRGVHLLEALEPRLLLSSGDSIAPAPELPSESVASAVVQRAEKPANPDLSTSNEDAASNAAIFPPGEDFFASAARLPDPSPSTDDPDATDSQVAVADIKPRGSAATAAPASEVLQTSTLNEAPDRASPIHEQLVQT